MGVKKNCLLPENKMGINIRNIKLNERINHAFNNFSFFFFLKTGVMIASH